MFCRDELNLLEIYRFVVLTGVRNPCLIIVLNKADGDIAECFSEISLRGGPFCGRKGSDILTGALQGMGRRPCYGTLRRIFRLLFFRLC